MSIECRVKRLPSNFKQRTAALRKGHTDLMWPRSDLEANF